MTIELIKDTVKDLINLFEFLEYSLPYYIDRTRSIGIPIYSDIIIFEDDLRSLVNDNTIKFLFTNNIARRNPYYPRIIEIISLDKLIEILDEYKKYKNIEIGNQKLLLKDPFEDLLQYVAPHVKDSGIIPLVKKIMLLQLFSDGDPSFRSRIHIALLGDPGTGKTLLLQWQSSVSEGIYVSLRTTSAGLSGSLNPDDFETSPPPLMAANGRILCIDEADKINNRDLDPLLSAMEEGRVILTGAKMRIGYDARVRVMISSNRTKFRPELLDRFDLVATFKTPTKSEIKEIVGYVIEYSQNYELYGKGDELIRSYVKSTENFIPKIRDINKVKSAIGDIIEQTRENSVRGSMRWLRFAYAYAKLNKTYITDRIVYEVFDKISEIVKMK
ncbi:MAG: AAA family ATPase [Nanopusillaceae archaeon]|jgi:DNA replicative helicase MCM subunit Mcm2 (Cdc46/Mcm family)